MEASTQGAKKIKHSPLYPQFVFQNSFRRLSRSMHLADRTLNEISVCKKSPDCNSLRSLTFGRDKRDSQRTNIGVDLCTWICFVLNPNRVISKYAHRAIRPRDCWRQVESWVGIRSCSCFQNVWRQAAWAMSWRNLRTERSAVCTNVHLANLKPDPRRKPSKEEYAKSCSSCCKLRCVNTNPNRRIASGQNKCLHLE